MRQFWGQQQRFFKEMANCAKVEFVVEQAKEALLNGMSIVVGLQSTGESGMDKVGRSAAFCARTATVAMSCTVYSGHGYRGQRHHRTVCTLLQHGRP